MAAAMENEPDNLFYLGEDDGSLVITLIDPIIYKDLIYEAQRGPLAELYEPSYRTVPEYDLLAHDFAQSYGLLMIPPLPSPVATLPLEALKEECQKARNTLSIPVSCYFATVLTNTAHDWSHFWQHCLCVGPPLQVPGPASHRGGL